MRLRILGLNVYFYENHAVKTVKSNDYTRNKVSAGAIDRLSDEVKDKLVHNRAKNTDHFDKKKH